MLAKVKLIKREIKYKGKVIDFTENTVLLPNQKETTWEMVTHPGAACIALYDKEDDKFFMVEQYRLGCEANTIEFCAGKLDNTQEDHQKTIIREAEEELGYTIKNLQYLGLTYPSIAFMNEVIHLYYGEADLKVKQHLDEDEFLLIKKYSSQEIEQLIYEGKIVDAKTIVLFYKLKDIKKIKV